MTYLDQVGRKLGQQCSCGILHVWQNTPFSKSLNHPKGFSCEIDGFKTPHLVACRVLTSGFECATGLQVQEPPQTVLLSIGIKARGSDCSLA